MRRVDAALLLLWGWTVLWVFRSYGIVTGTQFTMAGCLVLAGIWPVLTTPFHRRREQNHNEMGISVQKQT